MQYLTDAENILKSLSANYLTTGCLASPCCSMASRAWVGNTALIYGDYYFTEALLRLQNVLNGKPSWLLYSPVPEPSTWAMMLVGFAGLGFVGYRASRKTAAFAA